MRQVATLASLVEKETAAGEERPLVAAVYRNRLRIGMGMQADPTVIYALEKAGQYRGNLTRENLQFDSPYNTYRYAGLRGPIASGRVVVATVSGRGRHFIGRRGGTQVFASTLDEHNKKVFTGRSNTSASNGKTAHPDTISHSTQLRLSTEIVRV